MSRYVDISHFRAPYKNAVLQGFGAPEAVKLWYYDENPAGKVRCFVPAAAQVVLQMIAGNNSALQDVFLYAMPITVIAGVDITKAVPVVEAVKIVAVAKSGPQPTADQAIPLYQWVNSRSKLLQAVFSIDGTPLDLSTDALRAGKHGIVAGSNPQQIAGENMVIPSAIYANYTPVLPKPAPGGGGGGEEPSKAGIGPLGIATIAVVVVGIGYLALKKK